MDTAGLTELAKWLRERVGEGKESSQRQVALYTRLSPTTINEIYHGRNKRPDPETLALLAEYFHFPLAELMTIAGYPPSKARQSNVRSMTDNDALTVPLLGCIPAGYPDIIDRDDEKHVRIRLNEADRRHLEQNVRRPQALIVCGDSMKGLAEDGEIVIVDPDARAISGRMVVALVDGESTLKTLVLRDHESVLRSTNPAKYPDLAIRVEDRGLIQGVVVMVIPMARPRYLGPLKPPKVDDDF